MQYVVCFMYKDDTAGPGFRALYRHVDNRELAEKYVQQLNEIFGENDFGQASIVEE